MKKLKRKGYLCIFSQNFMHFIRYLDVFVGFFNQLKLVFCRSSDKFIAINTNYKVNKCAITIIVVTITFDIVWVILT
ncbi:hypothetical protein [Cognatitamlana onchidii]|uniref:hypothetical protein n=1 Tax=Cognatitamlana onchidii TaxID=2562860 RepID=UPI001455E22E|nr:hypothetical protein [Algibacter onchidii]